MNTAIIGMGSNINPGKNIQDALNILNRYVTVVKVSKLIKTAPLGIKKQPYFLNGAVKITTDLSQDELRQKLKKIEDELGRDRSLPRFGPRTIDLDLVVWNGQITDKDYFSRPFLQQSVAEISE